MDKVSPDNWLDGNFRINKTYLEWRLSTQIVGWRSMTIQESQLSAFTGETNNDHAGTTFWQNKTIGVAYLPNVTVQGDCSRDVRPTTKRF